MLFTLDLLYVHIQRKKPTNVSLLDKQPFDIGHQQIMIFWTVFFPMFWFILYYGVLLKRGKYGNLTPGQRLTISVAMVLYGVGILLMGIAALIYAVKSTWCLDVGATITTFLGKQAPDWIWKG